MSKLSASALMGSASHVSGLFRWLRHSAPTRIAIPLLAVALVVTGLLVGLPVKQAAGNQPETFAPLAPQADAHLSQTDVALDAPFQIQFTKPMNAPSVEGALALSPSADVDFRWDATEQTVSLRPRTHWQAFTTYEVRVGGGAADQEGLALSSPIDAVFETGALTGGQLTATQMVDGMASPRTAFVLTFTRPVKYAMVLARLSVYPSVPVRVAGDDPTDANSTTFTITPQAPLETGTKYLLTMQNGGADSSGSSLLPVKSLEVTTLPTPAIVQFTPSGGSVSRDTNQAISVAFSVPMDEKVTAAALRITDSNRTVSGSITWSDDSTVMTWTPRRPFYTGSVVGVSVGASARSTGGISIGAAKSVNFTISKARSTRIAYRPPTKIKWDPTGPQNLASERYYLALMNCTRTGGWVVAGGSCSSVTHHTRMAQPPLALSTGISDKVSRPYAKYMADTCQLNHYLNGTTAKSRLASAGYYGYWGENIAIPRGLNPGGLAAVEMFYQNESHLRGNNHYTNIMNGHFRVVGIGIWVSRCTRMSIDFLG